MKFVDDLEIDEDFQKIIKSIKESKKKDLLALTNNESDTPILYSSAIDSFNSKEFTLGIKYIENLIDLIQLVSNKNQLKLTENELEILQNSSNYIRNMKIRLNTEEYNKAMQEEKNTLLKRNIRI